MHRIIVYQPSQKEEVRTKYGFSAALMDVAFVVSGEERATGTDIVCNLAEDNPVIPELSKALGAEIVSIKMEKPATRLIDAHVVFLRAAGYQDLKTWMDASPEHVYIGRRGIVFVEGETGKERFPTKDSIWANPYKAPRDGSLPEVLAKYEAYIREQLASGEIPREELEKLRGRVLSCWCVGNKTVSATRSKSEWCCHGDVIQMLLAET